MSWFPASSDTRSRPPAPGLLAGRAAQPQDNQSPLSWARQRFGGRVSRRLAAAGQRAEHRLSNLGPTWHVVEWPGGRAVSAAGDRSQEHTGFLAVGPGGVYAVTVVDQGRQRVMLAGDVVQIQGKRPPLVANARRDARKASTALTAAVGTRVPVVPILTFVGSGSISAHGLPTGCLIVNYRELDHLLSAAGERISAATARKLAEVASHPATWDDRYRWYPDGQTAGDKPTTRR